MFLYALNLLCLINPFLKSFDICLVCSALYEHNDGIGDIYSEAVYQYSSITGIRAFELVN